MIAALPLVLALAALPAGAASTDTVAASTAAASDVAVSSAPAKAKPAHPIHAVIHREAKDWTPLAVKAGGDPSSARTEAVLRQRKVKGKYKGVPSKAKAIARLYKDGDDRWLVVSVFPKALERSRRHFEIRLKIVEGFVEEAKAAIVTVLDRRPGTGAGLDSYELRDQAVEFEEDSPASGTLVISALDPRPSRRALNSGALKRAAFGDESLGLVDVSWSVKGLPPPR